MGQVTATFQGHNVDGEAGLNFTLSTGPTPNVNQLPFVGTETTWNAGSLVFGDGTTSITITNLTPFRWMQRSSAAGQVTDIDLRDSRQNWQTRGSITGEYNKPLPDGAANNQKSLQALVGLCLTALGETGFNVSALPNDFYPYVRWEAARPGVEATRLCDMAQAVLGLASNGTAYVYTLGTGQSIPSGYTEINDTGQQSSELPAAYLVRGAQNIMQRTSTLVAVGLDVDDSIKPIASLSYYSALLASTVGSVSGAVGLVLNGFHDFNTPSNAANMNIYKRARASIGLWYQIPSTEQIYLPGLPTICETTTDGLSRKLWKKPYLTGSADQFFDSEKGVWIQNPPFDITPWEFEERLGVVKFSTLPGWGISGTAYVFPTITLAWAHHDLQSDGTLTLQQFYSKCSVSSPPANATLQVIPAEWLQLRKILLTGWSSTASYAAGACCTYGGTAYIATAANVDDEPPGDSWTEIPVGGTTDPTRSADGATAILNQNALDAVSNQVIALATPGSAFWSSAEVTYSGIQFIWPDGTVRQVTWHAGADGASTRIVYNTERPPLGGARLDRKIDDVRKAYEAKEGKAAAERNRLMGGQQTVPQSAPGSHTDPSGATAHVAPGTRLIQNNSGVNLKEGQWLYVPLSAASDVSVLNGVLPLLPGATRMAILAADLPNGATGPCYWDNLPHRMYFGSTPPPGAGQRIGSNPGSATPIFNPLGPFEVISSALSPYANVRFTGQRGDTITHVDKNGNVFIAKTRIWGTNYSVSEGLPGVAGVSDQ